MGLYFLLAWRNLWRNSHRTLITIASIFFAVILVLFMRSMQLGTYAHIIRDTVRLSTGYLQVQGTGYWDTRSLDNSIALDSEISHRIETSAHVTMAVPRFESFALASSGGGSRGISIEGIDPALETRMNGLAARVQSGRYLVGSDSGVLVGSKLAGLLSLKPGDSLVMIGQGYQGTSAAGIFPVTGIVNLSIPEFDSRMVYMTLSRARWLFSAPDRITALALMIDDPRNLTVVKYRIKTLLPAGDTVLDWREMMPELVQSIEFDNTGGIIMLGILYVIIAFGIFGTIMMMAAERRREFAILVSLGMKRRRITAMMLMESLLIGLLGATSGAVGAVPVLVWFHSHPIVLTGRMAQAMLQYGFEPIMAFQVEPGLFARQAAVVLLLSLLASTYPLWTAAGFNLVKALRA